MEIREGQERAEGPAEPEGQERVEGSAGSEGQERPEEPAGSEGQERPARSGNVRENVMIGAAPKGGYGLWEPVLKEIGRLAEGGRNALVAIDGRCGSGKTGLAGLIEGLFPCNVLHMDDFYLPPGLRPENWRQIPGGNMDFERLREELLLPLREGRTALYRPYSCAAGKMGEGRVLQPRALTVVEGSYALHPDLGVEYDLRIFLTCSREVQRRRLRLREGEGFRAFEQQWIPMEERYFQVYGFHDRRTEEDKLIRLDTSTLEAGFFQAAVQGPGNKPCAGEP